MNVKGVITTVFRAVIAATKEDCQAFFTEVKKMVTILKVKGYFRVSGINEKYIAYHVVTQVVEQSTFEKLFAGFTKLLSTRNAELSVYVIDKGKLFSKFEVLPIVEPAMKSRTSCITSAFSENDSLVSTFEPNLYENIDYGLDHRLPSVASSTDARQAGAGGFATFRTENHLSSVYVRMELEPAIEEKYCQMHEEAKTNAKANVKKLRETKSENFGFQAFKRENQQQQENDSTEKEIESKENELKIEDERVMFYCARNGAKDTKYIVQLEYFKQMCQYDVSRTANLKDNARVTYKIGLNIPPHCLQLFYGIFTNAISLQTVEMQDLTNIYITAQHIRCDKVMLAIVKEIVSRFLAIQDVTKLDEF